MIQNAYIYVYTCTYTSEQCTYMFIPLIVHTMYELCTDAFMFFQNCINMYIHVYTFPEIHIHVCTAYVL